MEGSLNGNRETSLVIGILVKKMGSSPKRGQTHNITFEKGTYYCPFHPHFRLQEK